MSCFHPLIGVVVNTDPVTGKNKIDVCSYSDERLASLRASDSKYFLIPCGKCIGCRLDYSRQWANRMMCELQYHDSAYFVTLTYSDDFLPKNPVSDPETGEYLYDSITLRKRHLSQFMKHVRKHFPNDKVRFFGSGEYGSSSFRPHYHIIIYGLHLNDLYVYKRTKQGDTLYISPELNKCWSNFVGFDSSGSPRYDQIGWVVVAPVTWNTCAYVARYVTKKLSGDYENLLLSRNIENPFSLMSRRPGIGAKWLEDHPEAFDFDYINLKAGDKGIKFRPPRYFVKLHESTIDNESLLKMKSDRMELFYSKMDALLSDLDKTYSQYLHDKEFFIKSKIKSLDRSSL